MFLSFGGTFRTAIRRHLINRCRSCHSKNIYGFSHHVQDLWLLWRIPASQKDDVMMIRVAIVGSGSMEFTRQVVSDLARTPSVRDATFHLIDIDPDRLRLSQALVRKILDEFGGRGDVLAFPSLDGALAGVHYVVNAIQVGGYRATEIDFAIPERYGIHQTIADTLGIGGIFRGLRTIPKVLDIAAAMVQQCPDAYLLNYTNPMSMIIMAVNRLYPGLKTYGLCHSVHYTAETLAEYLGVPFEELAWQSAGINHMAWMLELSHRGEDLYPRLFAAAQDPAIRARDAVRFELMERLGWFVTESSEHNAEYSAFFLKSDAEIERLKIPVGEYLRRSQANLDEYDAIRSALARAGDTLALPKSPEYAPGFIAARESGAAWWFHGNVANHHLIDNLPDGCAVEVPCFVNRHGVFASRMGNLPAPLAAMNRTAVNVQMLTVEAVVQNDRDLVYQAAMMDPLLASRLTLAEIWRLVDDLFQAHGDALPALRSRRLWMAGGHAHYGQ
jgi:alpha-galactosidase